MDLGEVTSGTTPCPVCGYATSVQFDRCPECGAITLPVVRSPNKVSYSNAHVLTIVWAALLSLVVALISNVSAAATWYAAMRNDSNVQSYKAVVDHEHFKLLQWVGTTPGSRSLTPPMPSNPASFGPVVVEYRDWRKAAMDLWPLGAGVAIVLACSVFISLTHARYRASPCPTYLVAVLPRLMLAIAVGSAITGLVLLL